MWRIWAVNILTWLKGDFVGQDEVGNKYYQERFFFFKPSDRRPRRWVVYNGPQEPSRVPPEWYGWLHFMMERPLETSRRYSWQKPYQPNLTGTPLAYKPKGHVMNKKLAPPAFRNYQPWSPSDSDQGSKK